MSDPYSRILVALTACMFSSGCLSSPRFVRGDKDAYLRTVNEEAGEIRYIYTRDGREFSAWGGVDSVSEDGVCSDNLLSKVQPGDDIPDWVDESDVQDRPAGKFIAPACIPGEEITAFKYEDGRNVDVLRSFWCGALLPLCALGGEDFLDI